MYEKIWDETIGEWVFYNIYCLRKQREHIDKKINGYTYENVVEKTDLKNKASNKWLSKLGISSGIPYEVVVINLDYKETYKKFWCEADGRELDWDKNKYELSLNEWKGKKTLQLKILYDDYTNNNLKDVLRNCYDNMIIIDFGFDYVLVVENIPMNTYFSIIDETKYNNNYPFKEYYYEDEYVNKYLNKYKNRDEFVDLLEIKASMINETDNKVKQVKRLRDEKGVDFKYAPAYLKYLKEKNPDFFGEEEEKELLRRREIAEKNKIIRAKKRAKQDKLDEIERLKQEEIKRLEREEQDKLNEIKRLEWEEEQNRLNEIKRLELEREQDILNEIKRLKLIEQERGRKILDFLEQNKDNIAKRIKELEKQDAINNKLLNVLTKK